MNTTLKSKQDQINFSENVCPTVLITDIPADNDSFSLDGNPGPHEVVAQGIASVILSTDKTCGSMIALEGGWGSGKTTVVNLMKNKLKRANSDIEVFSFDAWAHEGDPLRRTFLESLIQFFREIRWINDEHWGEWEETKEKLAHRIHITNRQTTPKATWLGRLFAISIVLVPTGGPFLVSAFRDGVTLGLGLPASPKFIIGSALSLAPILLLLLNGARIFISSTYQQITGKAGLSLKSLFIEPFKKAKWSFLVNEIISTDDQKTIETPDPTSIEFEDTFCRLMQSMLPGCSARKVVLVVDNLDRIDPKGALSIWSTLQTFLQCRNTERNPWIQRLWVVVPYDPEGLRLWSSSKAWMDGKVGQPPEQDENIVTNSFIDKSFQIRFTVPPPLLSNWKIYLENLIETAFPANHYDDKHIIYKVYALCRKQDGKAPTPRELKLYINQIGAVHRQWQHEFPIGHVAYYAILSRDRKMDIRDIVLRNELPYPVIPQILPGNLRESLAGLHFNVKASVGIELVFGQPIADAIISNDYNALKKLESSHPGGFWPLLERTITEMFLRATPKELSNAAFCLYSFGLIAHQDKSEARDIIQAVSRSAESVADWFPFDESTSDGIRSICRLVNNLAITRRVFLTMRDTVGNTTDSSKHVEVSEQLVGQIVNICNEIVILGHQDAIQGTTIILATNAKGWINICPVVHVQGRWRLLFEPAVPFDGILHDLRDAILTGAFVEDNLVAISLTNDIFPSSQWTVLVEAFQKRLHPNGADTVVPETTVLLRGLYLLGKCGCGAVDTGLKNLADSGTLMHHLSFVRPQSDPTNAAWLITSFLEQRPAADLTTNIGGSVAGHTVLLTALSTPNRELAESIVGILRSQENLGLLLRIIDGRGKCEPLIAQCLCTVADENSPETFFTPDVIISRWRTLRPALDGTDSADRFDQLISNENLQASLIQALMGLGFNLENAQLYKWVCKTSSSNAFLLWCCEGFDSLNEEKWTQILTGSSEIPELISSLLDRGAKFAPEYQFRDALIVYGDGLLKGASPSDDVAALMPRLLDRLDDASQNLIRRGLLKKAMDCDGDCAEVFFEVLGREISDTNIMLGERNVVLQLFVPLLKKKNKRGIAWLKTIFTDYPEFLDRCEDRPAVQDFRDRLLGEFENPKDDGGVHDLILEVADILKIRPPEEEPDGDNLSEVEESEEKKQ